MRRTLLIWVLFIVVLTAPLSRAAQAMEASGQATARQEILILNSYHPGYAWSDEEQAGIIDVFRAKDKNWFPVIEYLDLRRLSNGKYLAELKKLFGIKYQKRKFSVIIALDNPALNFAIDNQTELFRNSPIVFCGVNNFSPSLLKGHANVTGIVEAVDIAGTIEVMLRLHPDAREIFCPNDYTVSGLAVRKEIEALVPRFGSRVRFRFADPLTLNELLKELERLPGNSLVFMAAFVTDKSGHTLDVSEATELFYKHSPVPIYSVYGERLGNGIVGGKLLSARVHGAHAGSIALRVLAGEKASAIPIVLKSDAQFMFDYKIMSRFGIPMSALPEGSVVINKPVSFYAAHRVVIQAALVVGFFLIMVIFLLSLNVIQRKRSAEAVRKSEELLNLITSRNPDHILMQDSELRYSFVMNPQLGLTVQDMIGKTDHDFLSREDAERLTAIKRQVLETGSPVRVDLPLISTNGEQQYFSGHYIPKFDAKGRIDGLIGYFRNITERKRTEEALSQKTALLEAQLDSSIDGILVVDRQGKKILQNQRTVELWKIPREIADDPDDHRQVDHVMGLTRDPDRFVRQIKYLYSHPHETSRDEIELKDGRVLDRHSAPITGSDGEDYGRIWSFRDITERKRMEESMWDSEARYRELFDNISNGVAIYEVRDNGNDFVFKDFNKAAERLEGDRKENVIGKSVRQARPGIEAFGLLNVFKRVWKTGIPEHYPVSFYEDERLKKWFENYVYKLPAGDIVAVYDDVTDRKRAEEALRNSQEQMRALAGRLQAVREEERTNIAREIHDELGGALTGLRIDFSFLERAALEIENDTVRTSLFAVMDPMIKSVDATTQTVRRISMALRPGILDDLGLVAALEWQLKEFEKRTGIRCEFFPPVEDIILDADVSTALFRIVQEALTNVVRHSGATEVRVRLSADADSATLEVEDNGKGIEKEKLLAKESLGLLGMRERVQMFGGRISVTGTSGTGTKLTVEVPPVEKRKMDRTLEGDAG